MSKLLINKTILEDVDIVIFDKDGTLIDVHHYWSSMIKLRSEFLVKKYCLHNEVYSRLIDSMGIDIRSGRMKPEGPVGIKPRSFIINTAYKILLNYCDNVKEEDVSSVFLEVDNFSKKKLNELVNPLPGIPELLFKLKKHNIKSTIATTDLTERAELAMAVIEIKDLFDDIAGADLVTNAKPAPDLVNYILTRYKLDPKNAVVVGDSMADLLMARNSNCRFIGVETGLVNNEFVMNSEILIKDLNDIEVKK